MASGKFISYLRVSTAKQGVSGLGLEAQRAAVAAYLNGGQWKLTEEVTEIETGKDDSRPELARALMLCRVHGATLVVAKLDRLARSVKFLSDLMQSKVEFVACDNTGANRMMLQMMMVFAENEAVMISARTKAALAAAKARGVQLGGRRGAFRIESVGVIGRAANTRVRRARAAAMTADILPIIASIKAGGATSLRQIAAALNERSIPAAKGGEWTGMQVKRVQGQT